MLDTAERAGFEPATDLSARTRFPVALLRPLGHLSEVEQGRGSAAEGEGFVRAEVSSGERTLAQAVLASPAIGGE
jgi:hypothetical protein